jgi:hypothetical protein
MPAEKPASPTIAAGGVTGFRLGSGSERGIIFVRR